MRARPLVLSVLVALGGCATRKAADYGAPTSQTPVLGNGATQPSALYDAWAMHYRTIEPATPVAYRGSSSSEGVHVLARGQSDFAASDFPIDDAKLPFATVQIPTTLVAVAIVLRLDAVSGPLDLPPDLLAKMLRGDVREWSEVPGLAARAQGTKLPPIHVVLRNEPSGTTSILTEYLAKEGGGAWTAGKIDFLGAGFNSSAELVTSNDDLVARVRDRDGSLAFVTVAGARAANLSTARVRNAEGRFVAPTLDAISAAAAGVSDVRASLVDRPGGAAYPMASFTYAIVRASDDDVARGRAVARFLWWATHDGQRIGPALGFATLPATIVAEVETELRALRAGGEVAVRRM